MPWTPQQTMPGLELRACNQIQARPLNHSKEAMDAGTCVSPALGAAPELQESGRSFLIQVLVQLVPVSLCHMAPNGWAFSARGAFSPPAQGPAARRCSSAFGNLG